MTLVVLGSLNIDKMTEIVNEIYDNCDIPEDLSRLICIVALKKPHTNECELHWKNQPNELHNETYQNFDEWRK